MLMLNRYEQGCRHMVSRQPATVKRNQIRQLKSAAVWDYTPVLSTWRRREEAHQHMGKISVFRFSSLPLDRFFRMKYSGIHRKEPVRTKMVCHSLKKEEEKKQNCGKKQVTRIKKEKQFSTESHRAVSPLLQGLQKTGKLSLSRACRGGEWRSTDKSRVLLLDRSDLPGLKMQEPRHSLE